MKIYTTLHLDPMCLSKPAPSPFTTVITRGASAELIFDLHLYTYLLDKKEPFKYIDQITFLFKQNNQIVYYDLFDANKELNKEFVYNTDYDYISFILSPTETSKFSLANEHNPMEYEIAIQANTEAITKQGVDSIIIEKQKPILVVDSLYNKAKVYQRGE